jgi:nitrogen regulatory protein P-II 1
MQEIKAIIRPSKLEAVREALRSIPDFPGLSIAKIDGFTAPKNATKRSDAELLTDYSPKLMLCVIAEESMTAAITQAIANKGNTGLMGDGLIWTTPINSLTKIKTGQQTYLANQKS